MAARSPEPAKRWASPQSLSASAAGRRRASMSAKTSMAAERRAAGVMTMAAAERSLRLALRVALLALDDGGAMGPGRIVEPDPLMHLAYCLHHVAGMESLRQFSRLAARQHPAQQIVVERHFGQAFVADAFDIFLHETVVVAPFDTGGADGRLLGARGDLMRVK